MSDREDILSTIRAIEAQRDILGQEAVEAATAPLRARLAALGTASAPAQEAERKQITVMFADLSGFTKLSETADAEDVRNLVNACFEHLGLVATRLGGHIDKFIGDELMVLFGAPRAMEDHASRALHAALEMREALAEFNTKQASLAGRPLGMHFGINSGIVVAGGMGLEGRREYTVMGDPVNVAARLAAMAPTGAIFVGSDTRRLAGSAFDFEVRGALALDGRAQQVEVFELTAMRKSAQNTRGPNVETALFGREDELRILKEALDAATEDGQRHSIAVIGPAGIGKSRLLAEFQRWTAAERPDAVLLTGSALPHTTSTAYHLIADLIRRSLDIRESEVSSDVRSRLDSWLLQLGIDDAGASDALATVLAIESDVSPLRDMEPRQRRGRISSAVADVVRAMATHSPLVMAFEDLHWADIQSIELIRDLSTDLRESRILILSLSRPMTDDDAKAREAETQMLSAVNSRVVLGELPDESCIELLRALAPGLEASPEAVQTIVQKGQGNPFFVQAIVSTLLDKGIIVRGGPGEAVSMTGPIDDASVPDTVWGVLAERIDRLSPDQKQSLQMAAIIGRVFWEGLLSDLTGRPSIGGGLRHLEEQAFIESLGPAAFDGDWEWTFRHMLVHEVAYAGMLRSVRRVAHLRVAEWLEQRVDTRQGEFAPLLAYHFGRGEDWEKAAVFGEQAGDRAAQLYANREASVAYLQAIDALVHLPTAAATQRRLIELTLKLASVAIHSPVDDVLPALERAKLLALELEDGPLILRVTGATTSFLWTKYSRRGFN